MMNEFEDMTNAQLKEACEDFGLEVKAKNPAKPNKAEYLEALNAFKATQDSIHGTAEPEEEEVTETPKEEPAAEAGRVKPKKKQSPAQLMKLDLFRKERVIVRDMQESQTKDEMISVSWGNRRINRQTDWVDLSGAPQYIRRGAINNLKEASMVAHEQKPNGGVNMVRKPRFVVVQVDGLTEKEIADLAAQQKMRNSKLA